MADSSTPNSLYCHTSINYLTGSGPLPQSVDILDARQSSETFSWQSNGFELLEHLSGVTDWQNTTEIDAVHYSEIETLARALSNCDSVLFYPALIRNPEAAAENEDFAPILAAHSDYTEDYRDMIGDADHPYHALLAPSMDRAGIAAADIRGASRILTLQFWRNTGAPAMLHPLAFCDARTVARHELLPIAVDTYGGVTTRFNAFGLHPPQRSGAHRWYVYPNMSADEVVVFRAYDSVLAARREPFWTPHCSFRDPHVPDTGPDRCSIEMRAICLFSG